MTVFRNWLIKVAVAGSSGAVVGRTWVTSTADPEDGPACAGAGPGCTAATPGTAVSARSSRPSAATSAAEPVWATRSSGPLKPGPNPSASISYALYVVLDV